MNATTRGAIEYRFDADETYFHGYPCMREEGPYDDRIIGYDAVLFNGDTVWGFTFAVTRLWSGMTVKAAADALGVSPSTVRRWEDGKCVPATPEQARRYWTALITAAAKSETERRQYE